MFSACRKAYYLIKLLLHTHTTHIYMHAHELCSRFQYKIISSCELQSKKSSVKVTVLVVIFLIPRRKSGTRHMWADIPVTNLSFNIWQSGENHDSYLWSLYTHTHIIFLKDISKCFMLFKKLGHPSASTQKDGWGGRWEGGSGWGTHVHPWQIHVNGWQNQYNIVK